MKIVREVSVHDLNMEYLRKVVREIKMERSNYGEYTDLVKSHRPKFKYVKFDKPNTANFKFSRTGNHQRGKVYDLKFSKDILIFNDQTQFDLNNSFLEKNLSAEILFKLICEKDVSAILDES